MEVGKLTVQLRQGAGKSEARRLRSQGKVPGICYGAKLDRPLSVTVDAKELKASLDPERGRNTVISVTVRDGDAEAAQLTALLWEYQIDRLRQTVTHVDLISIDPDKEIEVEVPLVLVGRAKGLVDGGQIHVERHSIPVRSRPADIPVKFEVDVSPLGIGDSLHVADLSIPAGVRAAVPEGYALVTCHAPKAEKEVAAAEGAAPAEGAAAAEGAAPAAEGQKDSKAEGGDKGKK